MADLVIPAGQQQVGENKAARVVQVSDLVNPGEPIRLDATDGTWGKSNATEDFSTEFGIALTYGAADGFVLVWEGGLWIPGVAVVSGLGYVISATGGVAPESDLVAGQWVYRIGTAISNTTIDCLMTNTRGQK